MANISIPFQFQGNSSGITDLIIGVDELKKTMVEAITEANDLKDEFLSLSDTVSILDSASNAMQTLSDMCSELTGAYATQVVAETKLAAAMRNTMKASDDEIQSIKDLCAKQQEIGVVSDQVQLAGASELSGFLKQKQSLEQLIPVMNNLAVQQHGLNATQEDAIEIADAMGKAMKGQFSELEQMGIAFDSEKIKTFHEALSKISEDGEGEAKAVAAFTDLITSAVGEMNIELGQTNVGKQQQLANAIDDIKEKMGGFATYMQPFITLSTEAAQAANAIYVLNTAFKALLPSVYANIQAFLLSTATYLKNKVATLTLAAAQNIAKAASIAWAAIQKILNGILTANPLGLIITAVGALVGAIVTAYNNCEGFRNIVDQVWEAIKPLATAIMDGLVKAFEWLIEKSTEAWTCLKNLLHLDGKKVEVAVETKESKSPPKVDLGKKGDKNDNGDTNNKTTDQPLTTNYGAPSKGPVFRETAETLDKIEENIEYFQKKLRTATVEQAAEINKQISHWQEKADAIRNAGSTYKENASTLREFSENIRILENRLEDINSVEEAAEINKKIAQWQEMADAIRNAGIETKNLAEATDNVNPPEDISKLNTIGELGDAISYYQKQQNEASGDEIENIQKTINELEKKRQALQRGINLPSMISEADEINSLTGSEYKVKIKSMGFDELGNKIKNLQAMLNDTENPLTENQREEVLSLIETYKQWQKDGVDTTAAIADGVNSMGSAISNFGSEIGLPELDIVGTIGQAIATMIKGFASASAQATSMGPWGWMAFAATGLATLTTMISSVKGMTAFANGGIVSGPTVGLIGEYAGASNNPEVVAPLDRLRSMLNPVGEPVIVGGTLRASGRDLVCVLANETRIGSKSGLRTNIKI